MRCVLDSNVLVAALLSRGGTPAKLLRQWRDGAFELVLSPALLAELKRVLAYPKIEARVTPADASAFLDLLRNAAMLVDDPKDPPNLRTADPHDDYLVALARAARAVIVSGDKHLLDMAGQLPVLSPAGLLDALSTQENE